MDTDSIPRSILIILALILVSGFFAGAETAYANCSRIRLKAWADDGKKAHPELSLYWTNLIKRSSLC